MEVFRDLFEVFSHLKKLGYYLNTYSKNGSFEVVEFPHDKLFAIPEPVHGPLFRGQSNYYTPSRPSVFRRNKSESEQLIDLLRFEEWKLILQDNPYIKENINSGINVNYKGLAQHYGLDTNLIDLTNNIFVAAFFATTNYDYKTGLYTPVVEMVRFGVLYLLPFGLFPPEQMFSEDLKILPIGFENLKRPGEQRGFSYELRQNDDFNNLGGVHSFFFWHNPQISNEFFNMFEGGKQLFPYDPSANKAKELLSTKQFSRQAFINVCLQWENKTSQELEILLKKEGFGISDNRLIKYTEADIDFFISEHKKIFKY